MTSRAARSTLIAPPHTQSQSQHQPQQPHKSIKGHVIPVCSAASGGGGTTSTTTTPSSQTTTRPTLSSGSSSRRDISKTVSATKNLRAISLSLVQKLRCAPRGIPSTEIANQLAKEAVRQVVGTDTYVSSKELIAVEKNIRRRLYDSLKVLVSIGAIQRSRTNKMLHWQGVTHLLPPAFVQQQTSLVPTTTPQLPMTEKVFQKQKDLMHVLDKTRSRLDQKAIMLQQLMQQKVALERLCKRNKKITANRIIPHASKIFLPFVVVRTPYHTKINLTSTNDAHSMTFTFSENFEIVNDAGILDRLFCVDAPPIDQPSATPSPSSRRHAHSQSQFKGQQQPSSSSSQPLPPPPQQHSDSQLPQSQSASALTPHSANTSNPTLISHAPHSLPSSSSIPIPAPTPPPAPASASKPAIPSSSHPHTHVLPHSHPPDQSVHPSPPNSPQLRRMRYDAASTDQDHSPSFQSPKRIRLATVSASPFAKYTSGEKPPLSPGTPLVRRRARRLQRRVSESACASPPAPLSSSVAHPPLPPPTPRPPPPSLSAPSSSALPPPPAPPTASVSDTHSSSSPRPSQVIPHDSLASPSIPPNVTIQPTLSISDPFPLHLQPHPHSQLESPLQGSTMPPQLSDAATWSDPTQNTTASAPSANPDTTFKEAVATRRLYPGADVNANANVHVADHPVEGLVDDELVGSPMVTPKNWGLSVNGVKSCSAIDGRDLEARQLFINE